MLIPVILSGGVCARLRAIPRESHPNVACRARFQDIKKVVQQLKRIDVSKIRGVDWHALLSLADGVKLAYGDFAARCLYPRYFQE